jgi:chondroitin AC lyase
MTLNEYIKYFAGRVLFLCMPLVMLSIDAPAQGDSVIARYKRYLVKSEPAIPGNKTALYDSTTQWSDIDYANTQPANWEVLKHLQRTRDLAIRWADPNSPEYHDSHNGKIINSALDYWLTRRPRNTNWWHNQIGVPQYMRDIIVLMREELTTDQVKQALEVLGQYRLQKNGEGANLVWSADLGLHYAALTHNDTLIRRCVELVVNEIHITTGDGMQPDYSFHQHGARLQMYQYGAAFLYGTVRLAWELKGTPWAFPLDKTNILRDLVLEGWQWMARGINTVPGTIDRSVSRATALHSADLRPLIPYLCELFPRDADEFMAISDFQNGKGKPLHGFRYFPYSDFTAYHNKNFSFFVKTLSDRTLTAESINNENLKGHLMNSGDAYIVRNGNEYFDLMPCWDWERLPGITGFNGAKQVIRRPFTGSVSDGESGVTAMDYQLRDSSTGMLAGRKFWACHDGVVICLVGGLHRDNNKQDVYTVLNQCRQKGKVSIGTKEGVVEGIDHLFTGVKWIYHDGIAYLFMQPASIDLRLRMVHGKWTDINASGSREMKTEKIFMPLLQHRFLKNSAADAYVIASCPNAAEARQLAARPRWQIINNDSACQAVRFSDGTLMAAFFAASSVQVGTQTLSVDKPCLLMIRNGWLYASDPAQAEKEVRVSYNKKLVTIELPGNGLTGDVRIP